jgi:hypothetical protein
MAVRFQNDEDILIAPKAQNIPTKVQAPPRPAELPHTIEDGAGSEIIHIKQHPDRYNLDGDEWTVSAYDEGVGDNVNITPITQPFGKLPELHPLLLIDGIVIEAGDIFLVSQKTLNDIETSENPHYDIRDNGVVMGKQMGRTIPIIKINVAGLKTAGEARDVVNARAGVKSVDYIYESDMVEGVPQGLIDQIHYTFGVPGYDRPEDHYTMWELNLTGDYGTGVMKTIGLGPDGKVDRSKLDLLLKTSKEKINSINKDFNRIKEMYLSGKINQEDKRAEVQYRKRAHAFDPDHETPDRQYVVKESVLVSTQSTPVDAVHNALSAVADEVVKPVDGGAPSVLGTSDTQTGALISKWQGYGFSGPDKAYLKFTRLPTISTTSLFGLINNNTNIVTLNGKTYNIGIQWSPDVCTKARVVGEIHATPSFVGIFGLSGANLIEKARLAEYYGTGLVLSEYIRLNNRRKAELLELADKIADLEKSNGKVY